MSTNFKISVPKPCHENWNLMTEKSNGRFCDSCSKTVIDFTKMKTLEIQQYFIRNKDVNICGHFKNEQVNRFSIQIPKSTLTKPMSCSKAFLLLLFIVMGNSLFSCKNYSDDTLGEVSVIEDSISNHQTTGMPSAIFIDSINTKNDLVDGKVAINTSNNDNIKKK
jgi:hypothetical protein